MSLSYTGVGTDYASTTTLPVTSGDISMACWFNTNQFTAHSGILQLITATATRFLGLNFSGDVTDDPISFQLRTNIGSFQASIPGPTVSGWHCISGRINSALTSVAVFMDGTKVQNDDNALGIVHNTYTALRISGRSNDSLPINGLVAHCAVWQAALTDEEMLMLADRLSPIFIRPQSLKMYTPCMGRESGIIDVISGATLTSSGTFASSPDEPPVMQQRRNRSRIFVPTNYGNTAIRLRKSGGAGSVNDIGAIRSYLLSSTSPITGYPATLACRYRTFDLAGSQFQFIMAAVESTSADRFSLSLNNSADPNPAAGATSSGTTTNSVSSANISDNNWHHICGVFTSTTDRAVFSDGANKVSSAVSRVVTSFNQLLFGMQPTTTNMQFEGSICEPAIWNVALTDAEVAQLAAGASPLVVRPQNLVFYVPYLGALREPIDIIGGRKLSVWNASPVEGPPISKLGRRMKSWIENVVIGTTQKFLMFMR